MINPLLIIVISSVLFFVGCDSATKPVEQRSITFTRYYGNESLQEGNDVIQLNDGGYFVIGTDIARQWQPYLIFLKTDAHGNQLWRITDSRMVLRGVSCIQASNGNIIALVNGYFPKNINTCIYVLNASGILISILPLDCDGEFTSGWGIIRTRDGGFLVYGKGSFYQDPLHRAIFWKESASYQLQWKQNTANIPTSCAAYAVSENADGSFVVACAHRANVQSGFAGFSPHIFKFDASGNILWENTWSESMSGSIHTVKPTRDGGFIFEGEVYHGNPSTTAILLLKVDSQGAEEWHRDYVVNSSCISRSVMQDRRGGYIVSGITFKNDLRYVDALLIRVDHLGRMNWIKTFGRQGVNGFNSSTSTDNDGFLSTGFSVRDSSATLYKDILLVKVDGNGNLCSPIIKPRK